MVKAVSNIDLIQFEIALFVYDEYLVNLFKIFNR